MTYPAQIVDFAFQWYVFLIVAATIARDVIGCELDRGEAAPKLFERKVGL